MDGSPDDTVDFTDEFCSFLQKSVTSVDSAELLLALWSHRDTAFSDAELAAKLSPGANLSGADVARHIGQLQQGGLVSRDAGAGVRYVSAAQHDAHVQRLARLYNERPVTLFRVIHTLRDEKIKTLADAFRIWRK